jgi:ferredoxin
VLRYRSKASHIGAGALILDLTEIDGEATPVVGAIPAESRLSRILAPVCSQAPGDADSAVLRGLTIKETAGIFIIPPNGADPPEKQIIKGAAAAARASAYLHKGTLSPRATAVTIDSKLCRGCGDCAAICPYIEMREGGNSMAYAYVDQALCLGCGACIARCPTGAITQPLQSDRQIASVLEALLGIGDSISEAV